MPAARADKVVLIGGSGFLGRGLPDRLVSAGYEVVVIGRGPGAQQAGWREVHWDAQSIGPWAEELDGAVALVHLAGKRVDCRPTATNIAELTRSRVESVRLVGSAIAGLSRVPSTWVQLSSLARFGDTGISIGGAGDPATAQLASLARLGLGGRVGSGRQWVSWISATDMFDVLIRAVVDPTMSGVYHATSPEPVPNSELMAAYRAAVGRRFGLPSPSLITTVGAWLMGSDPELALTGRRCVPTRLLEHGFRFADTDLDDVVAHAVHAGRVVR